MDDARGMMILDRENKESEYPTGTIVQVSTTTLSKLIRPRHNKSNMYLRVTIDVQ